jgi:hypothetical protein
MLLITSEDGSGYIVLIIHICEHSEANVKAKISTISHSSVVVSIDKLTLSYIMFDSSIDYICNGIREV